MIKCQKYQISRPTLKSSLEEDLQKVNALFENNPERKIINIEHVISPSETTYGYNDYFICVWYSE